MEKRPIHYSLNLRLYKEDKFFGPGMARLLFMVQETGSLTMASKEMGMSYSKAWKMVKLAEEALGFPLLHTQVGGSGGGGAGLTARAKAFVRIYQTFEDEVYLKTRSLWEDHRRAFLEIMDKPKVGAVLMASGFSRRMGENKLLLSLGSDRVIDWILNLLAELSFDQVAVISQYGEVLKAARDKGFMAIENKRAHLGKSQSVVKAVRAMPQMDGYAFFTGDQILLRQEFVQDMLVSFQEDPDKILIPRYGAETGSPCFFPKRFGEALKNLKGEEGGQTVIQDNPDQVRYMEGGDQQQGWDFDTPEDWEKVRAQFLLLHSEKI